MKDKAGHRMANVVLSALTSPFLTVMDCLRGVISSFILDRKL